MAGKKIQVSELKVGTTVQGYMLVTKITERTGKKANWCDVELSDGNKTIKAKCWNVTKETFDIEEKSVIDVEIFTDTYMGEPSYTINKYVAVTYETSGLIPADFATRAPIDSEVMLDEIREMLKQSAGGEIREGSLAKLAENLLLDNKEKVLMWSAAESIHHNMYGGWLYHTLRMTRQAIVLAEVYPSLNKELLIVATVLHDIGKLYELDTDELGNAEYSIDGQLFGHAYIGMRMIEKERIKNNYNLEMVKCLLHCIASHHGKLEWGAITIPHIEEAAVLHYIDQIDSKVMQFEKNYEDMEPGAMSESRIFGLDNIKVYKPKFR